MYAQTKATSPDAVAPTMEAAAQANVAAYETMRGTTFPAREKTILLEALAGLEPNPKE